MSISIIHYYIIMNVIAFLAMGYDKNMAKAKKRRVSERNLLSFAILGGGLGEYLGMAIFHHKTKHLKFKTIVPISIVAHVLLICAIVFDVI